MALITCPECGREISDKAVSCPGCGCPVEEIQKLIVESEKSDLDRLVDEIWERNPTQRVKAIKELRMATGMDLKSAKDIIDIRYNGITQKEAGIRLKAELKEKRRQNNEDIKKSLLIIQNSFSPSQTPHCPKCRSTQITYGGNRISLGRAVVGGAVAGPAGATLGGLTGKKGYAVCLNCGKRWKI